LGVPPASIRFLGYPDRGLAALRHHWTPKSPYRSAHTGRAETGEAGAIPATPFCGEALLGDLVTAFREWRPQYLLFPDPQDDHRDHRATAWFTAKALSQLEDDRPAWIGRYLIHFGRWPAPHGFAIDAALTPPSRLEPAGGDWQVHPLNAAALQAKALAILAHPSQHLWAADLFGAHLRSNELFSREIRSNLPAVTSCRSC
jgi:LmbE family N-acetylglucosaminyl deacetylase